MTLATRQTASRQWKIVILLKAQRKTCVTMVQQYSITCIVRLYHLQRVDTAIFRVVDLSDFLVSHENEQ